MRLSLTVALGLLLTAPAYADEDRDLHARQLYELGRKAYNEGDFQTAYDNFKDAYSLSHKAALLYNVASALQQLKRPHDAAEMLRSYLRLRPDDSERAQIDERIKALDEEQRLLDIDHQKAAPPPPQPEPQIVLTPAPPPADDLAIREHERQDWRGGAAAAQRRHRRHRRRDRRRRRRARSRPRAWLERRHRSLHEGHGRPGHEHAMIRPALIFSSLLLLRRPSAASSRAPRRW